MNFFKPLVCFLLFSSKVLAQDTISRILTIPQLFELTIANSQQLAATRANIAINEGKTEIARSQRLPEIVTSADAGYLSTIAILNPDFSWYTNVKTPHFTNNYYLEANQTLYKGGSIGLNIQKSELLERLSSLIYEKDRQDIQLILLEKYLNLFQLYNGSVIYRSNICLARRRLSDMAKLKIQGLVTRNDIIRNELLIADFNLDLDEVENNIDILNKQLQIVLGLPRNIRILPDTTLNGMQPESLTLQEYTAAALLRQPAIKATNVSEQIAGKNVALEKSLRLPEISLYAGDALQRPFLYTLDPLNIYYNAYQTGIKLKYNISSLYHAKDRIKVARLELAQQQTRTIVQQQQTEIEVNTAFIKFREAQQHYLTLTKSLELADDNFRIVEKKYINQLSQITDILDASTAKLSAELRLSNARINIISRWYQLQKAAGNF